MRHWIEESGGVIAYQRFAGFVPMFCPSVIARTMKVLEPVVKALPLVNQFGCAVTVNHRTAEDVKLAFGD
jgi:hypothetical protein